MQRHTLPERMEHLLPDEAEAVDRTARVLVDYLQGFGYRLVMPPLAENLDTLLDGDRVDSLGEKTLRLTDPYGGGPIGIRADITPQVARIDERHFGSGVQRLCYCGSTLYSRPAKPWLNREQLQVGAEIYGSEPLAAACEIIMLATGALTKAGVEDICIALGHAGIVEDAIAGLPRESSGQMRRLLQRKDAASIKELVDDDTFKRLKRLMALHGPAGNLSKWQDELPGNDRVKDALAQLGEVATILEGCSISCTLDLTGLTGYEYHNGVAFAILGKESLLARGGHYGSAERPGCGFSVNARDFADMVSEDKDTAQFASLRNFDDPTWQAAVEELVAGGMQCMLVDDWQQVPKGCKKRLVKQDDDWQLTDGKK